MGLMGDNSIFVFGSNLAGRHGKGAALYARANFGAVYGCGEGLQGDAYAIPTKDERLKPLSLERIAKGIDRFIQCASNNPERQFLITPVGCGLAGYSREEIKPLFRLMPDNCVFTKEWDE